jgi:hypothetical protein
VKELWRTGARLALGRAFGRAPAPARTTLPRLHLSPYHARQCAVQGGLNQQSRSWRVWTVQGKASYNGKLGSLAGRSTEEG